jgi:hypothetical protein
MATLWASFCVIVHRLYLDQNTGCAQANQNMLTTYNGPNLQVLSHRCPKEKTSKLLLEYHDLNLSEKNLNIKTMPRYCLDKFGRGKNSFSFFTISSDLFWTTVTNRTGWEICISQNY